MRPGQNSLVILTALEEMAVQLSQQLFSMAPDQALLQVLSILPGSEYEVEKRTYSTGQRLDRDQVLFMIRTRYDNLQRQRNKGGGRRNAGHAFIADVGSSGKARARSTSRGARNRGGRGRGGRGGRGGNRGEKGCKNKYYMTKRQTSTPATETSTAVEEATQGATVIARSPTKRCDAPDRCVAFTMHQASFFTSLVNGVQMRSLGRW